MPLALLAAATHAGAMRALQPLLVLLVLQLELLLLVLLLMLGLLALVTVLVLLLVGARWYWRSHVRVCD